ncbi:phosphotransferase [Oceanicoccus sp. KOV_DT_Chl]|uniref:phosphotransferase n=1 Tax=Oceanicoccus sp. KOV_DT_Chl TaxID=1904639 RepID=UPI000C7E5407|nr:phosphotransferase [Oceanicoccus sp. KOV_DT_Chl]
MEHNILQLIAQATAATTVERKALIQSLWSGYGEIARYQLTGGVVGCHVVVKSVVPPVQQHHPRGWNTDLSHQRKLQSYQVEMAWYKSWALRCDYHCRVPDCYTVAALDEIGSCLLVLEDIDDAGFSVRKSELNLLEIKLCLNWLAHFHSQFLQQVPTDLWPVGCYWHLATRPDELAAMDNRELQQAASEIDRRLSAAEFKTIVHGDAKLDNFCFADDGLSVAAVDFQYVGGGCGIKDVAYFFSSCLDEQQCVRWENELLDYYFQQLTVAVSAKNDIDTGALEKEWRELYAFAWADFYRFLNGWMPGHWKINRYVQKLTAKVLKQL